MEIVDGVITKVFPNGKVQVEFSYPNIERLCDRKYKEVRIELNDSRQLNHEQRKKAYALMNDIAEYQGSLTETVKQQLKLEFITTRIETIEANLFSFSDCSMTIAKEFISFLVDLILEYGIPTKEPLYLNSDDITRYIYSCLIHKTCAVCGKRPADLHHFDQIGMGNSRLKMSHIGLKVISLCREHHTTAHTKGKTWLIEDLHLEPIPLTKEIGKVYKLNKKNLEEKK